MLRCQNLRAFSLDFSVANPHLVDAVHQLRDQIEIETGAAERRDLTLGRKDHASIFKRVIKIIAGHDGCKLRRPLHFSKGPSKTIGGTDERLCRLRQTSCRYL